MYGNQGAAVSLNVFNGRGLSDDEIALGMPDDAEAKNLKHHTAKCALRFRLFSKKLSEQGNDLYQIKLLVIGLGVYLVIVSEPARNAISFVLKIIGG